MTQPSWSCPHCRSDKIEPVQGADNVGACGSCAFVFPCSREDADGSTWRDQADASEVSLPPWPGIRPDRYRVIRHLASGAQGRILLAHHRPLDQICVIKILEVHDEWREVASARLQAEARAGFLVSHPNVARVLDCDCVEGNWYFVMEYVSGENLRTVVQQAGRLPWEQVVQIGADIAGGLAAIHAVGLIHRDLKPSNIMLRGDGVPKIMDLGLVKAARRLDDMALTHDGQVLGTPFYMAPEQFSSEAKLTPQADIYALGATIYHLLVGRPPHHGSGVIDLAKRHRRDPVVWTDETVRTAPSWLRHVVETCLAKSPQQRFASAEALHTALRRGTDVRSPVHEPLERVPRGIVITPFRNLSRREEDAWIGDALAEHLGNRLLEIDGVTVVDRANYSRVLAGQSDLSQGEPNEEMLLSAASKVGAGMVIMGSFQRSGDQLRVSAHSIGRPGADAQRVAVTVSGTVDDLFDLEDRLTARAIEDLGYDASTSQRERTRGTQSLAAHEKFVRGWRAYANGEYSAAIRLAEEALVDDPEFVDAVSLIGVCSARMGNYDRALEYHRMEEERARKDGDMRRLAEALGNLGVMYYFKGEYGPAYEFLEQAKNIGVDERLFPDAAKYHGNLGFVLMRLNRFQEAETEFIQAIDINRKYGDLVSLAWPYNGMGSVLLKQARYAEAAEYYRRALGLAQEIGDRVNVGVSRMNLGRCACLMGEFAEAEACFDEALEALDGTDFWNGLTLVYEHMADMYLAEGNTVQALEAIEHRLELAQKHENHRMEAEAWEQKAKAYEQAGEKDEAVRCLKQSIEVSQHPAPHESLNHYLSEIRKRPTFR